MSRPSSPIVLDSGSKIKSECSVLYSPIKVVKAGDYQQACLYLCLCIYPCSYMYILHRVDALLGDTQELKLIMESKSRQYVQVGTRD